MWFGLELKFFLQHEALLIALYRNGFHLRTSEAAKPTSHYPGPLLDAVSSNMHLFFNSVFLGKK